MTDNRRFTLRVYGLLIQNENILVAEERFKGKRMNKFPGGGLEWGEGLCEGLIREFKEETNLEVEIVGHFYTTDFFIASAFDQNAQLLSFYYLVKTNQKFKPEIRELDGNKEEDEIFKWLPIRELNAEAYFTFPIDQKAGKMLKELWLTKGLPAF